MESYTPKNIWLITDGKPGHETQLIGLGERLQELSGATIHWHHIKSKRLKKGHPSTEFQQATPQEAGPQHNALKKTENTTSSPDLLIAAGHRTHRTLYFLARKHKAFSTVLMKPSLPLGFFNAIICPSHDKLKPSERVLNTDGVINKVRPSRDAKVPKQHSILLGGPSKHFEWNDNALFKQIETLVSARPDAQWEVYASPRTPAIFSAMLSASLLPNLTFRPYTTQAKHSLQAALKSSSECWITPDSVSMIYESLTAGCATATFTSPVSKTKKLGRVALGLQQLIDAQRISQWQSSKLALPLPANTSTLWEADRATHWLLERFKKHEIDHRQERK
jgi:uncharacterized protein